MSAHILVVHDDEIAAELLKFLLARENYQCLWVRDMSAARQALQDKENPVVAVVSDINIPLGDGFQLLQEITSNSATASIPVIFLSDREDERDIVRALNEGAADYVVHPFQPQELLARIRRAMRLYGVQK